MLEWWRGGVVERWSGGVVESGSDENLTTFVFIPGCIKKSRPTNSTPSKSPILQLSIPINQLIPPILQLSIPINQPISPPLQPSNTPILHRPGGPPPLQNSNTPPPWRFSSTPLLQLLDNRHSLTSWIDGRIASLRDRVQGARGCHARAGG